MAAGEVPCTPWTRSSTISFIEHLPAAACFWHSAAVIARAIVRSVTLTLWVLLLRPFECEVRRGRTPDVASWIHEAIRGPEPLPGLWRHTDHGHPQVLRLSPRPERAAGH